MNDQSTPITDFFRQLATDQELQVGYLQNFEQTVRGFSGLDEDQQNLIATGNFNAIKEAIYAENPDVEVLFVIFP